MKALPLVLASCVAAACSAPHRTFIPAPTPQSPMSTALCAFRRPTFRWTLSQSAQGSDGAQVELCSDRACSHSVQTFTATGTSASAMEDLTPGVYFWRLRGALRGEVGFETSPVREFFVTKALNMGVGACIGTRADFNGDGFPDALVPMLTPDGFSAIVYEGHANPGDAFDTQTFRVQSTIAFSMPLGSAGDVDGDGFGDAFMGDGSNAVHVYRGSSTGLGAMTGDPIAASSQPQQLGVAAGLGDTNGDGFGDIAIVRTTGDLEILLGSTNGLVSATGIALPVANNMFGTVVGLPDVNGDGLGDVLTTSGCDAFMHCMGAFHIFRGGAPGGPSSTDAIDLTLPSGASLALPGAGVDVNADGVTDVVTLTIPMASAGPAALRVSMGGAATPLQDVSVVVMGTPRGSNYPSAVVGVGDVNGDGAEDIGIVYSFASHLDLVLGARGVLPMTVTPATSADLGATDNPRSVVVPAGDLDGDGYDDVVMVTTTGATTAATASSAVLLRGGSAPDWTHPTALPGL